MRKKYNHIFFDLDNTLWDFEKNSKSAMEAAFNKFLNGSEIAFKDFFESYSKNNQFLWDEYRNGEIFKKDLIYKRFKLTFDECDISNIVPEEMNAFYLEEMAKQKHLRSGAAEILEYLKRKNYKLYIITNGFKEVQYKKIETSGLKSFFRNIFVSEDVKAPKPGFEIFEYAIKSSNARKSESLMVGDDWEVDIIGATGFGIDAVYIPPQKEHNNRPINSEKNNKNRIYFFDEINELQCFL